MKCPLGRNADVVDAGPPWRRLDALNQLRHLPFECIGWPKEVGPEGDEQIAVLALGIRAGAGEQSQRLHHQCKTETFVAAERQQGAASCRRWIPGRLARGATSSSAPLAICTCNCSARMIRVATLATST